MSETRLVPYYLVPYYLLLVMPSLPIAMVRVTPPCLPEVKSWH